MVQGHKRNMSSDSADSCDDSDLDTDLELENEDTDNCSPGPGTVGDTNGALAEVEVLRNGSLTERTKLVAREVGRLVALSEDLEATRKEADALTEQSGCNLDRLLARQSNTKTCSETTGAGFGPCREATADSDAVLQSEFVRPNGSVCVAALISLRERLQEGARVHSQRIAELDSKFEDPSKPERPAVTRQKGMPTGPAQGLPSNRPVPTSKALSPEWALSKFQAVDCVDKQLEDGPARLRAMGLSMSAKEASHRVQVAQQLHGAMPQGVSARLARWMEVARGVSMHVPMLGKSRYYRRILYQRCTDSQIWNIVIPHILTKNITTANPLLRRALFL